MSHKIEGELVTVDNMIKFYKENLSTYGMVFKYFRWRYRIFKLALFLGLFGTIFIFPLVGLKLYSWAFLLFLFILAMGSCAFQGINVNSKKVLRLEYDIIVNSGLWRVESFEIKRSERIKKYLDTQKLFNSRNINLIINLLEKESERRKVPPFVKPGIILAFLVPVWVQFVLILYKNANVNDPISAFSLMVTVSIIVYFIVYVGGMTKSLYSEIRDTFFTNENILIKDFIGLLEDCLLRYSEVLRD